MRLYLDPGRYFPLVLLTDREARAQRAQRRRKHFRAVTVSVRDVTHYDRERARRRMKALRLRRPRRRASCLPGGWNSRRPCPFVGCRHHLYLDVNDRTGSIKFNFPDLEVGDLPETCALDVADRGGQTLEEVAELTNRTRERVRQVEQRALAVLGAILSDAGITAADLADAPPETEPPATSSGRGAGPRHQLGHLGARGPA